MSADPLIYPAVFTATAEGTVHTTNTRNIRIDVEPPSNRSTRSEVGTGQNRGQCRALFSAICVTLGIVFFVIRVSSRMNKSDNTPTVYIKEEYQPKINIPSSLDLDPWFSKENDWSVPVPVTYKPPTVPSWCDQECRKRKNQKEVQKTVSNILNSMNRSVDPCHDFYEYSCGNWGKVNPKPTGSNMLTWTNFAQLEEKNSDVLHGLLMRNSYLDDTQTKSAKKFYQDCVGDGPTGFKAILSKLSNTTNPTPSSVNMDIITKFTPNQEKSKVNYAELEEKLLRRFELESNDEEISEISIRDACLEIVQSVKGKRLIERLYLKNIILDNSKVEQVSRIMNKVQNSLGYLLGKSTNPLSKDDSQKWKVKASKIENSLKKVKHCIGYYKDLLNQNQFSVTLTDFSYVLDILDRINTTESFSIDEEDLSTSSPTCYWVGSPFETKAQYNMLGRSIEVTYGMIDSPFYNKIKPSAMNYGSIGVVMGHEVAHAININKYLKNNDLGPGPTCIVGQYSEFSHIVEKTVVVQNKTIPHGKILLNGTGTLEENFADNLGLSAAFAAFNSLSSWEKNIVSGLEDFTNAQLFFLAFGQAWCSDTPADVVAFQMLDDSHSPEKLRVLGTLRNSEGFATAFNCQKGSRMNPVHKCKLV